MPSHDAFLRSVFVMPLLLVSGCAFFNPYQDRRPLPPANPPTFCYETIGRAACYDRPQIGLGDLINAQVPPVVVIDEPPVILTPAPAVVLTPAQVNAIPDQPATIVTTTEEPPIIIKNPDPYPEPEDRAQLFTDAPVQLKAPAARHH